MRPPAIIWTFALIASSLSEDVPGPLVIPASQYFEGNDGPWSTFDVRVGTPEQYLRVLVSTASPETLVPLAEDACSSAVFGTVPPDCAVSRGKLFSVNESSSWVDAGLYGINSDGVGLEGNLGYNQRVRFGLEHLGIGLDGPGFDNQTVGGIATPEPFYLGIFGLNGQPVNFSSLGNNSSPSFFTALKDQKIIPSWSWSYTAGAKYRLKQVYGQLIFSGYDTSRFKDNTVSFTMAGDLTRDLIVALRSISYSGSSSATLLSSSIDIYIDSTDPNIWLPDEACDAFEKAFGLTLDAKTGLYLVNDTHRNTLLDSNVEVSFRLSDVKSGGEMVTVVLPYAAFDLTAEPPLVEKASYYFPLKRANNSGQYTLGRTFLQEAYLSADYERKVFNVSACVWDQGAQENIVTITSKDSPNSGGGSSSPSKSKISGGTLAGIIVGAILGALFLAAAIAVFILRKRRKWISTGFAVASKRPEPDESVFKDRVFNDDPRQGSTPDSSVPFSADDISASRSTTEFARPASGAISESAAAAAGSTVELDGRDTAVRPNTEIDGHEVQQKPLTPVAESPGGVFELPGSDAAGYGGRGRDLEPRPPSTVGSLPSRDDREGANHSPPSPLTSTFDGNWGVERNSKANSELVSPNHPNYRDGDRPF